MRLASQSETSDDPLDEYKDQRTDRNTSVVSKYVSSGKATVVDFLKLAGQLGGEQGASADVEKLESGARAKSPNPPFCE